MNDAIDRGIEKCDELMLVHLEHRNQQEYGTCNMFHQILTAMKTPEKTNFAKFGHRVPCDDPKDDWKELVSQDEGCPLWDEEKGCMANKPDKITPELPKTLLKD